ncbi:selenocysteine-specific translation elongation factor [bacterium]|nr:selenocysteine-specific translation elongation factor [bacterium]
MTDRLHRHIVLGMAGHIDHGKTALVKALTGTNTDRLKEEIERGMTTDLGFAFLGEDITIIDVPGHEKFVKTMVAGVNTVDMACLVIAADDGIMPQTIEHFEILNLLGIKRGVIALNKIDMVDPDWAELVTEDIRKLLKGTGFEGAAILPVSGITGHGVEELRTALFDTAGQIGMRRDRGIFRMPIDRVFTIKGFGTVVAGTVISGNVNADDSVELLPKGRVLRVRGLQVHEHGVENSGVGFRTAVNLQGIEKGAIERGDVLAEPGFYRPTSMMDAQFSLLSTSPKSLKNRARIRVHLGTSEVIARIVLLDKDIYEPGDQGFVQIRFEKPVMGDMGDRFVIRSYSPVRTIGGGEILDAYPIKHKQHQLDVIEKLKRLKSGDASQSVLQHLRRQWFAPKTEDELAKGLGITRDDLVRQVLELEARGEAVRIGKKRWISMENRSLLLRKVMVLLNDFFDRNPLRVAISSAELCSRIKQPVDKLLFDSICTQLAEAGELKIDGNRVAIAGRCVTLPADMAAIKDDLEAALLAEPLSPPGLKELITRFGSNAEHVLSFLMESGVVVRFEDSILLHQRSVETARDKLMVLLREKGSASISDIRQHWGTSRKYAVPLCIHFDNIGLTERDGDKRRLVQ